MKMNDSSIDWKHGDTATSGLLNVFGQDVAADNFDKTGRLSVGAETMDKWLMAVREEVIRAGGDGSVVKLETSLCAYRKFYKGTRYNGYYLDRMLEEVYAMRERYPEITARILEARKACFQARFLGESGGWRGVQKHMKTLYKNTGIIM